MLLIGQITFALAPSFVLRAVIAAVFAIPAAVAGYHVILGYRTLGCHPRSAARSLATSVRSSSVTRERARMTVLAELGPLQSVRAGRTERQSVLAARTVIALRLDAQGSPQSLGASRMPTTGVAARGGLLRVLHGHYAHHSRPCECRGGRSLTAISGRPTPDFSRTLFPFFA